MAEWVQKGNLKGPQGDPGQDAQLPAGGTEGQVLTKTADGEAWADAPEPDMTGVVKKSGSALTSDGELIDQIYVTSSGTAPVMAMVNGTSDTTASVGAINANTGKSSFIGIVEGSSMMALDSKSVTSITDDASTGSSSALATAKAVKDYVDDHGMPSVVPISKGGTGATTADGARTALGISVADPTELVEYVKSKLGGA